MMEDINNSQFAKARIWAFASGDNRHGIPVTEDALMKAESSIYDKPLVWAYNKNREDAGTHESTETPAGFVPRQNANITYERSEDGRLFFCVDALIWKYYSGKLLEIFQKADGEKNVSVEIVVLDKSKNDEEKEIITSFAYLAITVLGEEYTPAIPLANAQIVQFSKDKHEVEELLHINTESKEDEPMVFNKQEFATKCGMTARELWALIEEATQQTKYKYNDNECTKYTLRDYDESYVYAYNYETKKLCALPYSIENNECKVNADSMKMCRMSYMIVEIEVKEGEDGAEAEPEEPEEDMVAFAEVILSNKLETMRSENESLSAELEVQKNTVNAIVAEKETFAVEIEKLKEENVSLKEFKSNIEEQEKQSKIEFAMNEVVDVLSNAQIDEWKAKVNEFDSIDAFSNAVKAFAFSITKSKNKDSGINRISIPQINLPETKKGLWE